MLLSTHTIKSLYCPIIVAVAELFLYEAVVVEDVVGYEGLLVCDVELLQRRLAVGLDEAGMGDQVALVVQDEAADLLLFAGGEGFYQELVEVAQSEVDPHDGHHPVPGTMHGIRPESCKDT